MRTPRAIPLPKISARTHLPADEVRRFNPALVARVPGQTYALSSALRQRVRPWTWRSGGGRSSPAYVAVLNDFMRLEAGPERWDYSPSRPS